MEVIGNETGILYAITNVAFFVIVVFYSILATEVNMKNFNISNTNEYVFISIVIATGLINVMNFVMMYLDIKIKNIQNDFMKAIKNKKSFVLMYIKNFIWYIIHTIFWSTFIVWLSNHEKVDFFEKKDIIFFGVVALLYLFILFLIYKFKIGNERKNYTNYYNTINKIYEMEMCPNDCVREDCPRIGKDCCR